MTTSRRPASPGQHDAVSATYSHVSVVGRLGSRIDEVDLPSGDSLVTFTIVVDRPKASATRVKVDTLPCQAFKAQVRRKVVGLSPGDIVEATGRLQRRFWRAGAGLGSAVEIEVETLRKAG